MNTQTLIALAIMLGMGLTIVVLGRSPHRVRRVASTPHKPGDTFRPDVTKYAEHHTPRSR